MEACIRSLAQPQISRKTSIQLHLMPYLRMVVIVIAINTNHLVQPFKIVKQVTSVLPKPQILVLMSIVAWLLTISPTHDFSSMEWTAELATKEDTIPYQAGIKRYLNRLTHSFIILIKPRSSDYTYPLLFFRYLKKEVATELP